MEALAALGTSSVAAFLRGSVTAYLLVNAAHVLGVGLLIGAFAAHPLRHLGPPLRRIAATGLALAAVTGLLLFATRPLAYVENPAFLVKLVLLGLALLNILVVHGGGRWRKALAEDAPDPATRVAALVSLLAWPGVLLAGRWIGFLQ